MKRVFQSVNIGSLKRDLTLRFMLLLSIFLLVIIVSYIFSSMLISSKEHESILLDIASRQRMIVHQYASEINQVLVGLSVADMNMVIMKKNKADATGRLFENVLKTITYGGELNPLINTYGEEGESISDINEVDMVTLSAVEDEKIIEHLKHVVSKWGELKRIALLSLRVNPDSISDSPYVHQLLDNANRTAIEMDHVVQLMSYNSRKKLRLVEKMLLTMIIVGSVLFILIVYYVYSKIILPLDFSVDELSNSTKQLIEEKIEADKANKAKSEFLSRMSHELRTPMNAILGFGQLLQIDSTEFNDNQKGNVEEILNAGYHLLSLINGVLDLSRIETGKLEVSMEKVYLKDVLGQCVALISPLLDERHLKFTDEASNKGYAVFADFTRLKQVLINLLSNAVKYNCENGTIKLDCEVVDSGYLRILVTDTGEGISKDNISKLYSSFERLNAETNVEGSGIGLVITKNLIELMGGSIGVDSVPGKGSIFWVDIELFIGV